MSSALKLGVVGGNGWLGKAIARSTLDACVVVPENLTLSYRNRSPRAFPGVRWTRDNQELADRSDVIIISVRPADWPSVDIRAEGKLVISVMAGIRLSQLADRHKTKRVVRALPNAAVEVQKSFTPWVAPAELAQSDREIVRRIFGACGITDEVAREADVDYLSGFSGTGPAFPALLAAAMMEDAIGRGLDPLIARRAVNTLIVGAGRLLQRHDENPADTVETFMGYRGVTTAAITAMRQAGFDEAVRAGLAAAFEKSLEMGNGT